MSSMLVPGFSRITVTLAVVNFTSLKCCKNKEHPHALPERHTNLLEQYVLAAQYCKHMLQEDFAMGAVSGAFAAAATTPLDVIKTTMMCTAASRPNMISASKQILVEGGPLYFFRYYFEQPAEAETFLELEKDASGVYETDRSVRTCS